MKYIIEFIAYMLLSFICHYFNVEFVFITVLVSIIAIKITIILNNIMNNNDEDIWNLKY